MFTEKKLWVFFAVLSIVVVAGCTTEPQPAQTKTPSSGDVTVEYETSNTIPSGGNMGPSFKIGDRFEYETTEAGWTGSAKTVFVVKSTEKIGGNNYYVISQDYRANYTNLYDTKNASRQSTYYFDTKTGYFLKRIESGKTIQEGDGSADVDLQLGNIMFGPWMLSLNEAFKWERNIESNIGGKVSSYKNSFEVTGVSPLNGRKTFKVEYKIIRGKMVSQKEIFWVDSEKRITIKKEVFGDTGAKVAEINLVSGLN